MVQYSLAVRNARLDVVASAIGAAPTLELRAGAVPRDCKSASRGEVLARGELPALWMAPAANGVKAMLGPWELRGVARGKAGHFRLYDSSGLCHAQGVLGEDMAADDENIVPQQVVRVTLFNLRAGNE